MKRIGSSGADVNYVPTDDDLHSAEDDIAELDQEAAELLGNSMLLEKYRIYCELLDEKLADRMLAPQRLLGRGIFIRLAPEITAGNVHLAPNVPIGAPPRHRFYRRYVADYVVQRKPRGPTLDVECDSTSYHDPQHDARRDDWFRRHGWIVVRFPAQDIMADLMSCTNKVAEYVGL